MEKDLNNNLWKQYKSEKDKKKKLEFEKQLVEIYYSLVKKIAYKLSSRIGWRLLPEELTSFGVDGLYIAIRRFDLSRGNKFETFAGLRIHGSMIDEMRRQDLIPRSVRMNNNIFEKTKNRLQSEAGCQVSDTDVINAMGISEKKYFCNIKKYNPISFLSIDYSDDKENSIKEDFNTNLIDNDINPPDTDIKRNEFFNKLLSKNFSSLEREIVYLYYYENLTMDMISEYLGMSESRISQIHRNILPRLKNKIKRNPNYFSDYVSSIISNE
jgi:RNA polymerase sigma factor FliA